MHTYEYAYMYVQDKSTTMIVVLNLSLIWSSFYVGSVTWWLFEVKTCEDNLGMQHTKMPDTDFVDQFSSTET